MRPDFVWSLACAILVELFVSDYHRGMLLFANGWLAAELMLAQSKSHSLD